MDSHIESVRICWSTSCFDASHCSGKQLPRLRLSADQESDSQILLSASYLKVQKVIRAQFEDYLLQGGFVRLQEKELPPVSF
jgi:hypothetical protein